MQRKSFQQLIYIPKGKSKTLTAKLAPANTSNKAVTWTSSNTAIAIVSSSGVVTGKAYGTAVITATAKDGSGVKASCTVTVGYKITYSVNKGKNSDSNVAAYYKQKITLKNPTRKGYEFKGWYKDKKFKQRIKSIPSTSKKDIKVYAKWAKVKVNKTSITSAKNSKSKQIALKYKKSSGAKGYEISYSTNKKFKKDVVKKTSKKTSYTIKKLKKGKTYYVRVRAYKIDSTGNIVYGKYTKAKKLKISK